MNVKEVLGAFLLVNNPIVLSEEETKDVQKAIKQLQQENQKQKEAIFKIKMIISARIKEYQKKIDNEIDMGSQGDHFKICRYEENIKFLKDILKEVKTC